MARIKNSNGKYSIQTGYEYANELVNMVAKKLGENKTVVTGAVITTKDLNGVIDYERKKQFMGVKQYVINKELSGNEILSIMDNAPNSFFALSFISGSDELKIKPKAPNSGKPSTKGDEGAKSDFCKIKTSDKNIVSEIIFETPNFKEAEVFHEYHITEIILPEGEKEPGRMRELAKRKGKILRRAVIDGNEKISEKEFVA